MAPGNLSAKQVTELCRQPEHCFCRPKLTVASLISSLPDTCSLSVIDKQALETVCAAQLASCNECFQAYKREKSSIAVEGVSGADGWSASVFSRLEHARLLHIFRALFIELNDCIEKKKAYIQSSNDQVVQLAFSDVLANPVLLKDVDMDVAFTNAFEAYQTALGGYLRPADDDKSMACSKFLLLLHAKESNRMWARQGKVVNLLCHLQTGISLCSSDALSLAVTISSGKMYIDYDDRVDLESLILELVVHVSRVTATIAGTSEMEGRKSTMALGFGIYNLVEDAGELFRGFGDIVSLLEPNIVEKMCTEQPSLIRNLIAGLASCEGDAMRYLCRCLSKVFIKTGPKFWNAENGRWLLSIPAKLCASKILQSSLGGSSKDEKVEVMALNLLKHAIKNSEFIKPQEVLRLTFDLLGSILQTFKKNWPELHTFCAQKAAELIIGNVKDDHMQSMYIERFGDDVVQCALTCEALDANSDGNSDAALLVGACFERDIKILGAAFRSVFQRGAAETDRIFTLKGIHFAIGHSIWKSMCRRTVGVGPSFLFCLMLERFSQIALMDCQTCFSSVADFGGSQCGKYLLSETTMITLYFKQLLEELLNSPAIIKGLTEAKLGASSYQMLWNGLLALCTSPNVELNDLALEVLKIKLGCSSTMDVVKAIVTGDRTAGMKGMMRLASNAVEQLHCDRGLLLSASHLVPFMSNLTACLADVLRAETSTLRQDSTEADWRTYFLYTWAFYAMSWSKAFQYSADVLIPEEVCQIISRSFSGAQGLLELFSIPAMIRVVRKAPTTTAHFDFKSTDKWLLVKKSAFRVLKCIAVANGRNPGSFAMAERLGPFASKRGHGIGLHVVKFH
jgi:hypothetical protein